MSLTIEARGHEGHAALAEMATIFFGPPSCHANKLLEITYDKNIRIISQVDDIDSSLVKVATTKLVEDKQSCVQWSEDESVTLTVPRKELRRETKRQLYEILSRETAISFPWGSLTGVRPTQIACQEIERAWSDENSEDFDADRVCGEVIRRLTSHWGVSDQKATLVLETALAEQSILSTLRYQASQDYSDDKKSTEIPQKALAEPSFASITRQLSAQAFAQKSVNACERELSYPYIVYVGLPFCPSRCAYCSFIAQDAGRHVDLLMPYVEAVIAEARGIFSHGFEGNVAAVYFGGGTPTSLPTSLFKRFVEGVLGAVPMSSGVELTMEAGRPDTIDEAKLEIIRDNQFSRLCINPQTMLDKTLRAIGRGHSVEDTVKAFSLARSMGFQDINMDLIAGLPGEGAEALLSSTERIVELYPESITLHTLAVKRGSKLIRQDISREVFHPDEELIDAVERSHAILRSKGYRPYYLYRQKNCRSGLENTGFSREGHASIYNVAMMSDVVPVIGLGSGATSKAISGRQANRVHNPKDLQVYISRVEEQVTKKRDLFQKTHRDENDD